MHFKQVGHPTRIPYTKVRQAVNTVIPRSFCIVAFVKSSQRIYFFLFSVILSFFKVGTLGYLSYLVVTSL